MALLPVKGVQLGIAKAGIKKKDRKDLLVMRLEEGAHVAGVFTKNRFCAAPVTLCKTQLSNGHAIRAMVVNTGNANAGTGEKGMEDAKAVTQVVAEQLGIQAEQVLPFSTGVILEPLPVNKILAGLPDAVADLDANNWSNAAEAIMTTDLVPKSASKQITLFDQTITITGISKGSGMIHPNMATMLGYIATDAAIAQPALVQMIQSIVGRSFNCITVDGDTSTNDSFMIVATNQAQHPEITAEMAEYAILEEAIGEVAVTLAQAIVRDGEGATKFITIQVEGGQTKEECRAVADAIAHSPLVKTAFFASDPNLGRILAAIGYAKVDDLDVNAIQLYLGDVLVAEKGGVAASYQESKVQSIMDATDILIRVDLNRGAEQTIIWTCDFSYDYVKINADYRS